MTDDETTAEHLISYMDYAGENGAVITQEEIEGKLNDSILFAKASFPSRLKICSLYEDNKPLELDGFDGIKICACRLAEQDLTKHNKVLKKRAKAENSFVLTFQTVINKQPLCLI